MKLDCVLTATNQRERYIEMIPIFIKYWKKLYPNVDIKIIVIGKIPDKYKEFSEYLIEYDSMGMNRAFVSQYIRLLYPALLNYQNGVLITDIDNLPLNKYFFTENIKHIDDDMWVNYYFFDGTDNKTGKHQINISWNVTKPSNWAEVFNIHSIEDVNNRLQFISNSIRKRYGFNKPAWYKDQKDLYRYISKWNKKNDKYIVLENQKYPYNRLCRADLKGTDLNKKLDEILKNVRNGVYSDYHILRPYSKYESFNEKIYESLSG